MPSLLSLYLPTLILGSVIWVIAVSLASTRPGLRIACGVFGGVMCLTFLMGAGQIFLQSLLLLIVGMVCLSAEARWRTFAIGSAVASAAAALLTVWFGSQEVSELVALREQYPFESLGQRLAYERPLGESQRNGPERDEPMLSPAVETSLAEREARRESSTMRSSMLQRLHDDSYARFVAAEGFGAVRMLRVRPRHLELPDVEPIPLADAPPRPNYSAETIVPLADAEGTSHRTADAQGVAAAASQSTLESFHSLGSEDFTDPERMGYVERRDRVAGFSAHRMTEPLEEHRPYELGDWQVTRLELISLLKHDPPRAYVSEHLPNMDELRDAPIRPLEEFETKHLPDLRANQNVVFEESRNWILMLGALRAGTDCLQCHQVRRGELLGAFTYVLDRMQPLSDPRWDDKHASVRPGRSKRVIGTDAHMGAG